MKSATLLLLSTAVLSACALLGPAPGGGEMTRDGARFVGSRACAGCHPREYEGWSGTRHPHQEQLASAAAVRAPFDGSEFTLDGSPIRAWKEGQRYFVHTLGPDGEPEDFPVLRTIGGYWKQRYVTRVEGRDLVLPLQWNVRSAAWKPYSSAGHESLATERFWADPSQGWAERCSGCHTVGTELRPRPDGGYDATYTELGVGCESCHGPGSRHLEAPSDPEGLVDLAALPPARQVDVCAQCHSRGHALPGQAGAPTRTRFPWRFRPGEDLAEHFVEEKAVPGETTAYFWPDGSSRAHHQQAMDFRLDRHFQGAGMVCTSCHDPHERRFPAATRSSARDDELCLSCHDWPPTEVRAHSHHDPEGPGSTCIACHMPRIVNHAEPLQLHSHTRWAPDPTRSLRLGMPDACTLCHQDRDQDWAAERARSWWRSGK